MERKPEVCSSRDFDHASWRFSTHARIAYLATDGRTLSRLNWIVDHLTAGSPLI